jgi:uncharacterized cupredoxin-like copper-binding protein
VTRAVAVAVLAAVALTAAGCAREAVASEPAARDRTMVLRIRHSRFSPASFTVREGTTVRFVVHNDDPIDHELIVGDAGVQLRHELGTERWHPPRPGEVSIAAESLASTTYTFAVRGHTEFACHMPGHYAYGMRGMVTVTR